MTTVVMYQNCLAADRQHSDSISRSSYLAKKLAISTSGCLALSVVGDTKPVTSLTNIADAVEELIIKNKDNTTELMKAIYSDVMEKHLNPLDLMYFIYKYDSAIYMTYTQYDRRKDKSKLIAVVPPAVGSSGSAAAIAEFLIAEQSNRGELNIAKIYKAVSHFDPCTSKEYDVVYGDTLNDMMKVKK